MLSKHILTCTLMTILGVFLLPAANGIKCYQCTSTDSVNPFQCNEFMPDDSTLEPMPCDKIDNAQYCIKHVGRTQGAIKCYQCDSSSNLNCSDVMIHDKLLKPKECSHIAGAAFCYKAFGRYAGEPACQNVVVSLSNGTLGTLRDCSTNDLGNQCMEVKQVGDALRYRSCIYTCNTDGCNAASSTILTKYLLVLCGTVLFALL